MLSFIWLRFHPSTVIGLSIGVNLGFSTCKLVLDKLSYEVRSFFTVGLELRILLLAFETIELFHRLFLSIMHFQKQLSGACSQNEVGRVCTIICWLLISHLVEGAG